MAEEDLGVVYDACKEAMEKALRSLKADLQKVRTGRASTALLDGLQVDYYGTPTPLNQLANLTVPDARLIVIAPYDKGAMQGIERATRLILEICGGEPGPTVDLVRRLPRRAPVRPTRSRSSS